ncbi:hypothetical protein LguiA_016419 [Lonicera macranthoides]
MEIAQRGIERKRSTACGEILDNKANGSLVPINIVTHAHQLPKEFLEPFAKNYLLLDLPGIIKVVKDGKGRGRQITRARRVGAVNMWWWEVDIWKGGLSTVTISESCTMHRTENLISQNSLPLLYQNFRYTKVQYAKILRTQALVAASLSYSPSLPSSIPMFPLQDNSLPFYSLSCGNIDPPVAATPSPQIPRMEIDHGSNTDRAVNR